MKLITAIAALALVVGSFILIQPVLAQVQNADEDSWCVEAGYAHASTGGMQTNLRLVECDSHYMDIYEFGRSDSDEEIPPHVWGYDPETQYIRTLTKPYRSYLHPLSGDRIWEERDWHRCFSTNVATSVIHDPHEWNPLPWMTPNRTRFKSHWCGTNDPNAEYSAPFVYPDKWLYDSDTKLLSLDSFPDWCLTMSPSPRDPESESPRFLFLARCGDATGHWAELEAAGDLIYYPEKYSQRWDIPLAEPEEQEEPGEEPRRSRVTVPGEEEEPEEEPLRSRVTVPGEEEEESEDDGPILNKDGDLGSKKRGKN